MKKNWWNNHCQGGLGSTQEWINKRQFNCFQSLLLYFAQGIVIAVISIGIVEKDIIKLVLAGCAYAFLRCGERI